MAFTIDVQQEAGKTLDQFLQKLKSLIKDCNVKLVTAEMMQLETPLLGVWL